MSKAHPYTPELFAELCDRISDGRSLRSVCSDEDMPSKKCVLEWVAKDESLRDQYARACEERAETIFEDTIEIADETRHDFMVLPDGREVVNNEAIQRSRLRVDTRKWFASKLNPKKYGERIQTEDITQQPRTLVIVSPKHGDDKTA